MRGQPVDQLAVVADEYDGAGEIRQRILEDLLGGQVEVVGGLVEKEQVALVEHQPRQRQPAAFAAGKLAHPLEDVIATEEQARQMAPSALLGQRLRRL